jgi:hypothetical protein
MEITFLPASKKHAIICPYPKPAKNYIPDFYKKAPSIPPLEKSEFLYGKPQGIGIKSCIPFLDGLTSGYIQETWCDIFIKRNEENPNDLEYYFSSHPEQMSSRTTSNFPVGDDFYPVEFTWKVPWIAKAPKGYSLLYTHPLSRIDLPFVSMSAVVDSDNFYHVDEGNYPFYIKNNFIGLIPAGTPMYQIIPIKRDSWKTKTEEFDENQRIADNHQISKKMIGAYKKFFWQKKEYN